MSDDNDKIDNNNNNNDNKSDNNDNNNNNDTNFPSLQLRWLNFLLEFLEGFQIAERKEQA